MRHHTFKSILGREQGIDREKLLLKLHFGLEEPKILIWPVTVKGRAKVQHPDILTGLQWRKTGINHHKINNNKKKRKNQIKKPTSLKYDPLKVKCKWTCYLHFHIQGTSTFIKYSHWRKCSSAWNDSIEMFFKNQHPTQEAINASVPHVEHTTSTMEN